jgi:outer membrane receptor for ferrienterochelin and colicin
MAGQQPPAPATYRQAEIDLSLLTSHGLTVTNTYLFDSNKSVATGQSMYNAHFLKSNWNWQFSRELSLRFIGQYNATLANPSLTTTPTARGLNADVLLTYLVHPGTALYVGYNSNLSKPGPAMAATDPNRFTNDGRQFFVKLSYLLRF